MLNVAGAVDALLRMFEIFVGQGEQLLQHKEVATKSSRTKMHTTYITKVSCSVEQHIS